MKILSEIDDDPCTLIKCLLVSKTFLDSIAYSSDPEKDWERRCKRMLTIRRYPDCETWKETYLQMVRRRCARCFKGTSARLGRLFESGPRCIVVCEACQLQPGPYQVITLENAVWQWPTIKDYLGNLRLKFRKVDDQYWVQDCLVSTVTQLANQLKTDKESVIKVPFMMDWRRGIRIYPEAV